MQLLQAISMLLLGSVFGVLCTLFDVTVVGSAAFLTRFTLWVLFNVLLATHVRNRWRAVWWSIPFNLGLVECYVLCTSFSFENVSRKIMLPFALLALVAPLLVSIAWTVRHERQNLFGRLLGVLFALVILVVSAVSSHGITAGNVVCILLSMLFMFFVPTHTVAMVELDADNRVVRTEGEGVSRHEPRERVSASRQMHQRRVRKESREQRRQKKNARRVGQSPSSAPVRGKLRATSATPSSGSVRPSPSADTKQQSKATRSVARPERSASARNDRVTRVSHDDRRVRSQGRVHKAQPSPQTHGRVSSRPVMDASSGQGERAPVRRRQGQAAQSTSYAGMKPHKREVRHTSGAASHEARNTRQTRQQVHQRGDARRPANASSQARHPAKRHGSS